MFVVLVCLSSLHWLHPSRIREAEGEAGSEEGEGVGGMAVMAPRVASMLSLPSPAGPHLQSTHRL